MGYVDPQTLHNPATGTSPPATWGQQVRDNQELFVNPPRWMFRQVAASGDHVSGVWSTLGWSAGTEREDSDGFHSETVANTRVTIPAGLGGYYLMTAGLAWGAPSTTGIRGVAVVVNGTDYFDVMAPAAGYTPQTVTALVDLAVADYVEVELFHTRTVGLATTNARFSGVWVSD